MAAAMRNLYTLINHHIGQAPNVELVKRGHKTLLIPEGTPESQLGLLLTSSQGGKKKTSQSGHSGGLWKNIIRISVPDEAILAY